MAGSGSSSNLGMSEGGADSQLNCCARLRQDELERAWWSEQATMSAGPSSATALAQDQSFGSASEAGTLTWQACSHARPDGMRQIN